MIRLTVAPTDNGRFTASVDGAPIVVSRQPLVDGARELLKRGFDGAEPMTMRHAGSQHDATAPLTIAELAKITFAEGASALRACRWAPFDRGAIAVARVTQKSASDGSDGTTP